MYLGPVCGACKYTLSRKFFLLDAADERNLIKLGMHFQAELPNFERPQQFYFVLGPCVKYRSSISSASSLLTTPDEFSIVSRKRDRLSTVQIKHSMGFSAFPQPFWEAQTFPEERGGIQLHSSGNWILPLHGTSLGSAIRQRNPHARHVCGDAGEWRWTSTACCGSLRWARRSSPRSQSRPQEQRLSCGLPWRVGTHKAFILCHPSFSGLQSC